VRPLRLEGLSWTEARLRPFQKRDVGVDWPVSPTGTGRVTGRDAPARQGPGPRGRILGVVKGYA
jgi:hypothetical protein